MPYYMKSCTCVIHLFRNGRLEYRIRGGNRVHIFFQRRKQKIPPPHTHRGNNTPILVKTVRVYFSSVSTKPHKK